MIQRYFYCILVASLLTGCSVREKGPLQKQESQAQSDDLKTVEELIPPSAKTDNGLLTTHTTKDDLFFEIPEGLFGKDLLLVSRIAAVPSGFGGGYVNAGSKVNEQVVRWDRRGDYVDLRVMSFEDNSSEDSPIYKSVVANNFSPILYSSKILAKDSLEKSVVIKVTDLFNEDVQAINAVSPEIRKRYDIRRLDGERSYIQSASAYPKNVEIKHVMTYEAENPPEDEQTGALSLLMNQSMILLPEDRMKPRIADHRVGWFTVDKFDYDSEALKSDDYELIRKWRLVPKDMEAYARGELVEPVKPIVYYLDPATPLKWRPYFRKGIEDWNKAFEAAGFKNAIIAKDPPSPEEDPEFSPEDVRYSVVRYVASTTRNAVGPSVIDPRTGEILESDIIWYHNHLRSYRNRFMIEAGAQNPDARTLDTPESEIGEMMRMVIAHEVGHALGLPHNMKASSAYPTDSLRSATFTQKYGLTPSIMDYARVNYVAQPEDKGVRYIRMMGPYDLYAINWGYRYLPNLSTKEEKEVLDDWIEEKEGNPIYEFGNGYGGFDPQSQRESLGADQIKASTYGVRNLKKVIPNLVEWTSTEGEGYEDLEELYRELTGMWYGYMNHVVNNIGGIYETRKTSDQDGMVYKHVPEKKQESAIEFLNKEAFETPEWLLSQEILGRIDPSEGFSRVQELQERILENTLEEDRLNRLIANEEINGSAAYTALELIQALRKGLFEELYKAQPVDTYRRNLQTKFVEEGLAYVLGSYNRENGDTAAPDAVAVIRGELETLKKQLEQRTNKEKENLTTYHWNKLLAELEAGLSNHQLNILSRS